MKVGLVTCVAEKLRDYFPTRAEPAFLPTEPPFTPDDQLLVDELRRHGHEASPVVWDRDPSRLAQLFDVVVVRSPWDFMDSPEQRQRFLDWIEALDHAGLVVENAPRLMNWLLDKRYLQDLAHAGAAIVPTRFLDKGANASLSACFDELGPLVVKPSLSAAGVGLQFLPGRAEAAAFQDEFDARCRRESQLIQPFLPEIRSAGEWSLIYLGGRFSHAAHKAPAAGSILVHAEQGGSLRFADPPDAVRRCADEVSACLRSAFSVRNPGSNAIRWPPVYLRIDVIESAQGPLVSECEGVEPELFFRARPDSVSLFRKLLEERSRCVSS